MVLTLRTTQVPVFEYKLHNSTIEYRFTNCVTGFSMPIKTSWTKDVWLYPTKNWKTIKLDTPLLTDSVSIPADFYIRVKKAE